MTALDDVSSKITLPADVMEALTPLLGQIDRGTHRELLTEGEFADHLRTVRERYEYNYPTETRNGRRTAAVMARLLSLGLETTVAVSSATPPPGLSPDPIAVGDGGSPATAQYVSPPVRITDENDDHDDCEDCTCSVCDVYPYTCCGCCQRCECRHEDINNSHYLKIHDDDSSYAWCTSCTHFCYTDLR